MHHKRKQIYRNALDTNDYAIKKQLYRPVQFRRSGQRNREITDKFVNKTNRIVIEGVSYFTTNGYFVTMNRCMVSPIKGSNEILSIM